MASTKALVNQRSEEVKQKNGQAEGIARRVLKDIGNLVIAPPVDGKPQTQINSPITRKFGAQPVAKAAGEKNMKKLLAGVGMGGVVDIKGVGVAIQKKECENQKHNRVVILNPAKEVKPLRKPFGEPRPVSSKKAVKTLTSILSARSKAASGLVNKPKDLINIDASDVDDELCAVEYVDDIYTFYRLTEDDGRVHDYMSSQPDINSKMRAILIDWLVEIHRKFELMPESLYLTINIVDRYLSLEVVSRRELQLVGISSMLIASKYEEIWAPEVRDFIAISDNAYVREQVLTMEKAILGKLEWYLTVPTPYVFLVRYIKSSVPSDLQMENMVFFLAELGVMHYSTITMYRPSMIAASAVYAARHTLNKDPVWTETIHHYTGYSADQLRDCAKLLITYHHAAVAESKLKAVYRKFSDPDKAAVALCPGKTL